VRSGGDVGSALRAYCQHLIENPEQHQLSYELTQYALRTPELAELAAQQYESYLKGPPRSWRRRGQGAGPPGRSRAEGVTLQWLSIATTRRPWTRYTASLSSSGARAA